jgi:hypothetical protein
MKYSAHKSLPDIKENRLLRRHRICLEDNTKMKLYGTAYDDVAELLWFRIELACWLLRTLYNFRVSKTAKNLQSEHLSAS